MNRIQITISSVTIEGNYLVFEAYKESDTMWSNPEEVLPTIKLALDLTDKEHQGTLSYLFKRYGIPAKPTLWERIKCLNGRTIEIYDAYIVTGEEEMKEHKKKKDR